MNYEIIAVIFLIVIALCFVLILCVEDKISTLLKLTIIPFVIITLLSLGMTATFIIKMNNQQEKYANKYEKLLETIQKDQSNKKAKQTINQDKKNEDNYKDFLSHYYETQSNWLTFWLTVLAIVLGVIGIIAPILIADKKKEIDTIIEKGEKDLESIRNYVKKAEESEKRALASANWARANQFLTEIRYNEAIEYYNKAIELNPHYNEAYCGRGIAYTSLGNFAFAIKDFNKAIELNPDYNEAYCGRGITYSNLGNYPHSIEDFNKAIELTPYYKEAYSGRGIAYSNQKKYQLAIEDFNKAIQINPYYKEAYSGRGIVYSNQEKYQLAIEDFNKAIELGPYYKEAYYGRGIAYLKQGKYQLAIEDFNIAIKLNYNLEWAYYNLTGAYIFNKQFDKALDILRLLLQKVPQPFIFSDDYDKCINVLNISSEDPNVKQIIEIIEKFQIKDRD